MEILSGWMDFYPVRQFVKLPCFYGEFNQCATYHPIALVMAGMSLPFS